MLVKDKLKLDLNGLIENGAVNIVVFGDSVTHGALLSEVDYETVYWNVLKKKLNHVRDYVPVNVINSGIGGITAFNSVNRIQRDVLSHHPDLVIICFGLNDVNIPLEDFLSALKTIFNQCTQNCEQVIYLSPNMLNTYVSPKTEAKYLEYAAVTADYQNNGRMDLYIDSACDLARKSGVLVCDAYRYWKSLADSGVDTTALLINHINHPTREMHKVFADMLFELIMSDDIGDYYTAESTMYDNNC